MLVESTAGPASRRSDGSRRDDEPAEDAGTCKAGQTPPLFASFASVRRSQLHHAIASFTGSHGCSYPARTSLEQKGTEATKSESRTPSYEPAPRGDGFVPSELQPADGVATVHCTNDCHTCPRRFAQPPYRSQTPWLNERNSPPPITALSQSGFSAPGSPTRVVRAVPCSLPGARVCRPHRTAN